MSAGWQGVAPFIGTKLEAPAIRELVPRRDLLRSVTAVPLRELTLIRAPAGWGKTTLLTEWHAHARPGQRFAWLALEPADNDPVRFWSYLVEALRMASSVPFTASRHLLRAPGVDLAEEMLPTLANEAAALPEETVLALDDYHVLHNDEIHQAVAFLIDHLPSSLRLVLASRSDPPLPLARLRVRQQLTEIETSQLRFSAREAEVLLNEVHTLDLDPADVARLNGRTEGWAAGLYLAVLSLSGREDRRSFIDSFAGDHRHVVDYLGAEVLADPPERIRTFLLSTSVLERFCAPLCDAVTGGNDAAELLGLIERSNYFLVPLDTRREWYRYHHLFGELLQNRVKLAEPERVADLHRRAAAWLRRAGFVSEAIHHTIAAGDPSVAGELIASHWLPHTNGGDRGTVLGWLDALPPEAVLADARLCIARALTLFAAGRLDEVLPWADAADGADLPAPFRDEITSVAAGVAAVRASYWLAVGDFDKTREYASEAIAHAQAPAWRAVGLVCLGACCYWLEQHAEAAAFFEEAVPLARDDLPLATIFALGSLALIAADREQWDDAERLVETALDLVDRCGADEYWMASAGRVARGRLLVRRGRFADAEAELERGVALARRGAGPVAVVHALLTLGGVKDARGGRAGARALVVEARQHLTTLPEPADWAFRSVQDMERRLRLASRARDTWPAGSAELSARELAVIQLLPTELSQREIGDALYVSRNTVKTHMRSILRKLEAQNRREAVERARELGLLS